MKRITTVLATAFAVLALSTAAANACDPGQPVSHPTGDPAATTSYHFHHAGRHHGHHWFHHRHVGW